MPRPAQPLGQGGQLALSPVQTRPVSQTVLVDGGPDSLLQLTGQHLLGPGQPAIIADNPPPAGTARWEVTDGQPRADTQFGLVDWNVFMGTARAATKTNPPSKQLRRSGCPAPAAAAGARGRAPDGGGARWRRA